MSTKLEAANNKSSSSLDDILSILGAKIFVEAKTVEHERANNVNGRGRMCSEYAFAFLIRSISSSGSAKRCAQLVEIQEFFDNQRKTILKLVETRWLALHQCVVRVLECWPSLIDREIMIHKLFDQSLNLMKIICQNFVKPSFLDISCLNFGDISNLLPVEEVFVGAECQSLLNLQSADNINVFKEKCQKLYITVAEEIIKRLPISNNLFKEFKFLDPEIALDANNRAGFANLPLLTEQFAQNSTDEMIKYWVKQGYATCKTAMKICKLLGTKNGKFSSDGFCDWKHAAEKLSQRETSKHHLEAIIAINHREREIAANSCVAAIRFFDFIQNLYVFFTTTSIRYSLLTKKLACIDINYRVYVLKNLNETRWSCRADATKAVVFGYDYIKEALVEISNYLDQKDIVKIEYKKLYESMCLLEVAFYVIFWNDILELFNLTSHLLQDLKIILQTAINVLNSLLSFVREIRNKYDEYKEKVKKMSGSKDYAQIHNR
ncbi:hypothetical protein QTP88_019233 [Uroleucon formosanum]